MFSVITRHSRWGIALWVVFLVVVIAFRWFGNALLPSGADSTIQVRCGGTGGPTSSSTIYCNP